jgi:hypothetical protein
MFCFKKKVESPKMAKENLRELELACKLNQSERDYKALVERFRLLEVENSDLRKK